MTCNCMPRTIVEHRSGVHRNIITLFHRNYNIGADLRVTIIMIISGINPEIVLFRLERRTYYGVFLFQIWYPSSVRVMKTHKLQYIVGVKSNQTIYRIPCR